MCLQKAFLTVWCGRESAKGSLKLDKDIHDNRKELNIYVYMGWPKSSFEFSVPASAKSLNELNGQHDTSLGFRNRTKVYLTRNIGFLYLNNYMKIHHISLFYLESQNKS